MDERMHEQGGFLSPEAWDYLAHRLGMSHRERQIAQGILADRKELAIAHHLGVSAHTVHTHLERLYRKLGVGSRLQLATFLAWRHVQWTAEPDSPLPPICGDRTAGRCPLNS